MNCASPLTSFRGILLDAYGVFWGGGTGVIPGSHETMHELIAQGKIVGILSNSTQSGEREKTKFARHGLIEGTHYHFVLTSGDIARALFISGQLPFTLTHNKYWILGEPHPHFSSSTQQFEGTAFTQTTDLSQADFILPAIPHRNGEDQTDPELFRQEVLALIDSGLPLVCINPDTFAHEGNPPRPVVRQGSLAAMYAENGGTVFSIGKPSLIAFEAALDSFRRLGIHSPQDILMVGDTPETDIRGARAASMASLLITQTGIFAHRYGQMKLEDALKQLPPSDSPDFTLEQFPHDLFPASQSCP